MQERRNMLFFNPFRKPKEPCTESDPSPSVKQPGERKRIPIRLIFSYPYLPARIITDPYAWNKTDWKENVVAEFLSVFLGNPNDFEDRSLAVAIKESLLGIVEKIRISDYRLGGYKVTEFNIPTYRETVTKNLYYVEPDDAFGTPHSSYRICLGEMYTTTPGMICENLWLADSEKIQDINLGLKNAGDALRETLKLLPKISDNIADNDSAEHLKITLDISDKTMSIARALANNMNVAT